MTILVTGAAGFIGNAVAGALTARGDDVIGLDNLNDYYDPALKQARLDRLGDQPRFRFVKLDIADPVALDALVAKHRPARVIHLAAQAGVRYGAVNPHAYADSNLTGFLNVLEACRHHGIAHLVYASSSSVYGANTHVPFSVSAHADHPVSLYAATKKANEAMAHAYAHLYQVPMTGLRFFTVYGPWGRPDMAPMIFTRKILADEAIAVFNHGRHARDFTYIDDIVEGVLRVLDKPATPASDFDPRDPDPALSSAPHRLYNIGRGTPVALMDFIAALERALGRKARLDMRPMQPGDVETTSADIDRLRTEFGYAPATGIEDGLQRLVGWYRGFYGV